MKNTEVASAVVETIAAMTDSINNANKRLCRDFKANTDSNADAAAQADMHKAMARFIVVSDAQSMIKKMYDRTKQELNDNCTTLGIDPNVESGESKAIYQDNVYLFTKKRNAETQTTSLKDFVIELNKLGVDKEIIDNAYDSATKPRAGSEYFNISVGDYE
tara:strand:+ start:986 stop:1468 length:483 start_codon:yes stop_codon:yes gene_type:complete